MDYTCHYLVLALAYSEGVTRLNIFKGFANFFCVYTPTMFMYVTYKLKEIAYFSTMVLNKIILLCMLSICYHMVKLDSFIFVLHLFWQKSYIYIYIYQQLCIVNIAKLVTWNTPHAYKSHKNHLQTQSKTKHLTITSIY